MSNKEKLTERWTQGRISEAMLRVYVRKGIITKADFEEIFLAIKNTLGSDRLKSFHSHFSKIEYTAGGEKRHLTFDDTVYGPEYEPVMELTYKYGCDPVFICESAGTQAEDARQMKDYYNSIRGEKQ